MITHWTNTIVIAKLVDLDSSCIYNHKHMVEMEKISSNVQELFFSMLFVTNQFPSQCIRMSIFIIIVMV